MAKENVSIVDTDCSEMSEKKNKNKTTALQTQNLNNIQSHSFLEVCPVIVPEKPVQSIREISSNILVKLKEKRLWFPTGIVPKWMCA